MDATLSISEKWRLKRDQNNFISVALLDLSKAFNCIRHDVLIHKLVQRGFGANTVRLIKNYLADRRQAAKLDNVTSSLEYMKNGVPQGRILGPLLFLVYANDLPISSIMSSVNQYADDTCIYSISNSSSEATKQLKRDISLLKNWVKRNYLKINLNKTKFLIHAPAKIPNKCDLS